MNQPQDQNVGVYYPKGNQIIYLNKENFAVEKYDAKTGLPADKLTTLRVGCKTQTEADEMDADTETSRWESRNSSSVQYTGMPKAELAILNYDDRIIELYDQKTGLMSSKYFKIPDSVTIHLNFNFCYNNGRGGSLTKMKGSGWVANKTIYNKPQEFYYPFPYWPV